MLVRLHGLRGMWLRHDRVGRGEMDVYSSGTVQDLHLIPFLSAWLNGRKSLGFVGGGE